MGLETLLQLINNQCIICNSRLHNPIFNRIESAECFRGHFSIRWSYNSSAYIIRMNNKTHNITINVNKQETKIWDQGSQIIDRHIFSDIETEVILYTKLLKTNSVMKYLLLKN